MKEKAVAEYAGISVMEVYALDVFAFWALLHDAVVYAHSQTKSGRQWLRDAWRLTQTEPDDEAVDREIMRRGGKIGGG